MKYYQPWSCPVLHSNFTTNMLKDLIDLTDMIAADEDKVSAGKTLAGEIEREWVIDPILLTNIGFHDYINKLSQQYKDQILSQYPLLEFKDVQTERIKLLFGKGLLIKNAWFNDQLDDEYNPIHSHTGLLSGVLYLKIPEYLPSRKNKNNDGSIIFVANEGIAERMLIAGTIYVSPKVEDIFLFPSVLKHMVYPFRTKDKKGIRRSMSFNLVSPRDCFEGTRFAEVFKSELGGTPLVRKI